MSHSALQLLALLDIAAKATVLLALATAADRWLLRGRASAATRHLLWSVTLGALLLLPAVRLLAPALRVPTRAPLVAVPGTTPIDPSPRTVASQEPPSSIEPSMRANALARITPARSTALRRSFPMPAWPDALLFTYFSGVLLLLARIAAEQRLVRRLERGATPLRDREWMTLRDTLAARLGVRQPVTMLHGSGGTMPLTWGLRRAAILLPASATEWPLSRRRAVLLHELAHVARRDCLTQTLAAIACAVYWPHPGLWLAARRLRADRELACDDRALLSGIGAYEYAEHLLEIARAYRVPGGLRSLAVSMAAPSHLEMRLRAVIDPDRPRETPRRAAQWATILAGVAVLLPLAPLRGGAATPLPGLSAAPQREARGDSVEFIGEWSVRLATTAESKRTSPTAHVALRTPGLNTFYVSLDSLTGLSPSQLASGFGPARFILRRDAGTFAFAGTFRDGRGTGRFVFTPDSGFVGALEQRGLTAPTAAQQFSMGRHDVTLAFLDELLAQGYARPTTAALEKSGLSGVDLEFLRAMRLLGYRLGTLDALMAASANGVTPELVRELRILGYPGISVRDIVRLHGEGIDAVEIRSLNEAAGRHLGADELVAAHFRDREPRATSGASERVEVAGPAPVASRSPGTPFEGRWLLTASGSQASLELQWTDDTQWRRTIGLGELQGISPRQVAAPARGSVAFRIEQDAGRFDFEGSLGDGRGSGSFHFTPNRDFVATLRSLGVRGVDDVSDHILKNLAFGGISATSIREFHALGFSDLTLRDVADLAVFIVSPEYVRAIRTTGVTAVRTARDAEELRHAGVAPVFAAELAAEGFRDLDVKQVTDLWRARVTPELLKSLRGRSGVLPTVDEIIRVAEERHERRSP